MSDQNSSAINQAVFSQLESLGFSQRFFYYFTQLSSIPRGSGNTKAVSDYCAQFAQRHKLRYVQDSYHNIIMYQDGTPGYEDHPTVILQGHLDMVCVQVPECTLDMQTQGLRLKSDGSWLWAEGTTLGADDGIAVAYALAILEAEEISHPPLEVIFTTDEETGMSGAHGLDPDLIHGRVLLNLDSEDEGLFTAGCSGGSKRTFTLPVRRERAQGIMFDLCVSGLLGGHSGMMIAAGRANACKVLAGLLDELAQNRPLRLISCGGGEKDNAIPHFAHARILVPQDSAETVQAVTQRYLAAVRQTYAVSDPGLEITLTEVENSTGTLPLDISSTNQLIRLLCALPSGVQAMMPDIPGLPETSANLGVLTLEEKEAQIQISVRSCVKQTCLAFAQWLDEIAAGCGASSTARGAYPPWEYRKDSPLRDVLTRVYQQTTGAPAKINVIHAGLECGILYEKLPGLDAISFGPTILDIHSPNERFELACAVRTWNFLLRLLEAL